MTLLQERMIARIALSEFTVVNGTHPETYDEASVVWADVIIDTPADKGTFTSLLNAGLAWHEGTGRDALVRLTEAGYAEYLRVAPYYERNGRPAL